MSKIYCDDCKNKITQSIDHEDWCSLKDKPYEIGKDVESVNRTINLHPIAAIANQEIEVRLPLELGPQSYITNYEARREDDTIILRVWSANLGVDKE